MGYYTEDDLQIHSKNLNLLNFPAFVSAAHNGDLSIVFVYMYGKKKLLTLFEFLYYFTPQNDNKVIKKKSCYLNTHTKYDLL